MLRSWCCGVTAVPSTGLRGGNLLGEWEKPGLQDRKKPRQKVDWRG